MRGEGKAASGVAELRFANSQALRSATPLPALPAPFSSAAAEVLFARWRDGDNPVIIEVHAGPSTEIWGPVPCGRLFAESREPQQGVKS